MEKSIFIILEELFKICRDGFSEKELKQAKRILIHRCQIENDFFVNYANFLQNQWSIDKPILTLPKLIQKYQKINLEEIQNVFKTVFCPLSKLYISCVGDNLTKFRKHKLFRVDFSVPQLVRFVMVLHTTTQLCPSHVQCCIEKKSKVRKST